MTKRKRDSDSDDSPATSSQNTVFIDTNLETHLAMIVSDSDTVSDLKKKIMCEHPQCFPNFGQINIGSLKVKRKGYFYHLSDSMLVRSAFEGAKKSWFLSVDAASLKQQGDNQSSRKPDTRNQLALFCITTTPGHQDNHLPYSPLERISVLDTSPLLQAETNAEHKDGSLPVGVNDVQFNNSPEGSLRTKPASKKKRCKESEDVVSNCFVKDSDTRIVASASHKEILGPEFSLGNTVKEVLKDVEVANTDVGKEPREPSLLDSNMRSDSAVIPRHVESINEKSRSTIGDEHLHDSVIEGSKSIPAAKEKRKRESRGAGSCSERNKSLLNFSEETSKAKTIIPAESIEDKEKITTTMSDGLLSEPPEDVHLAISSTAMKKKKRKKLAREQVVTAEPSSVHNFGEETFKENVDMVLKDSGKASDGAIVSEQSIQHRTGCLGVCQNEKNPASVKEALELDELPSSSIGIDVGGHDAINAKGKNGDPEVGARSATKGTKNSKKQHSTKVKELTHPSVDETNSQKKNIKHSEHKNTSPADHKVETSYPEKFEDQRKLPQNHDSEAMWPEKHEPVNQGDEDRHSKAAVAFANLSESNLVTESGKHADSKRMKKRAKKSVGRKLVMSDMAPADKFESGIHSNAPHSTSNGLLPAETDKEESFLSQTERTEVSKPKTMNTSFVKGDDMSGNEAESLTEAQVIKMKQSAGPMDENKGKKGKKNRSSDAKTSASFPVKKQANEEPLQGSEIGVTQKDAENMDVKSRKKTIKNKNAGAKILPDMPIKEQQVGGDELTYSNDRLRDVDTSSKTKRKSKSVKTSSKNQLVGQEMELERSGTECGSVHQLAGAKILPDVPITKQQVGGEELTSSNDRLRELDTPCKTKRKTKSVKTSSNNQLIGQELELENNGTEHGSIHQHAGAKILPDVPIKEQQVGGEVDTPSKIRRKTKKIKTSSKNQLIGQMLELESSGTDRGSIHSQQPMRTADLTHVPLSDTLNGNAIKPCNMNDADYEKEISKCDGDGVNFKDYFVTGEHEHKHEVEPVESVVDKVSEPKKPDSEVKKPKKKTNMLVVPSSATSSDLQNSLKSHVNQGSEIKLLSKSSRVSDDGGKALDSRDITQIKTVPQETKQPNVDGSLISSALPAYPKENSEYSGAASSSCKSSDKYAPKKKETKHQSSLDCHHTAVSKASNGKMGEVVNSSRHQKSLLATPGAIFRDGTDESSDDESVNSDTSTKTPSDNSSSSGSSEEESETSMDAPRTGSYGTKGNSGAKSRIKSLSSGPMTLDMIIRSSSRFKKAKLAASQSQLEDTESQPVDFVPDSQANL